MSDSGLTVRRWSIEEWMTSEGVWSALLARSNADKLFLSWGWLTHWWLWFGGRIDCKPNLLACYRGPKLVGVAPFYRRLVVRGGLAPARSMQLIGLSWRDPAPLISEYLDVIAAREEEQHVRQACTGAVLDDHRWTELVVGLTTAGREWRELLGRDAYRSRCYVRELDRSVSYQADLANGFSAYLNTLGQSTRRSVWYLRRRLKQQGEVLLEQVSLTDIPAAFADLNRLHQLRWNKAAFVGRRLAFHVSMAICFAANDELALSRLRVGGKVASVLYDVRKGACQYNIKMAFDPNFNKAVSLGLIHLGYAMEAASERGVAVYDFLAGPGRSSDYKRYLSQARRYLSSVQMVRGRVLPRLYRWHDRAP